MGKARDEAGNIWETDAQGNPVRMLQPAQSNPMNNPFVDPRLQYQVQQERSQAAAAPYAAPKAQADATIAQANAGVAPQVARAEAAKAQADAARAQAELQKLQTGALSADKRAETQSNLNSLNTLQRGIDEIAGLYKSDFQNQGLSTPLEFAPGKFRAANANLNDASRRLSAFIAKALELNGQQFNTPKEQQLFIESYLPSNTDRDSQIEKKVAALSDLLNNARKGMASRLGIEFTPYQNPLAPPGADMSSGKADYSGMQGNGNMNAVAPGSQEKREPDAQASAYLDSLIRQHVPYGVALRQFRQQFPQAQVFSPGDYNRAVEWRRQNPNSPAMQGAVTRTVPMNFGERVMNNAAQSGPGALVGHYANSMVGGIPQALAGDQGQFWRATSQQQHPGMAMTGDVLGAVGGSFLGNKALKPLNPIFSLGKNGAEKAAARRMITADMLYGSTYGATQNPDDPLTGAVVGAGAMGAGNVAGRFAIGPGLRLLGETGPGQRVAGMFGGNVAPALPSAEGSVLGQVNKSGFDDVTGKLRDAADLNMPYSLADADPRLRMLAGSATRKSPDVRKLAEDTIGPRQQGQAERAIGLIDNHLAPSGDLGQIKADATARAQGASSSLYEKAKAYPAPQDQALSDLLRTPAGESAAREAYAIALNKGENPAELSFATGPDGLPILNANPNWRTLHYMRQGVDSVIEKARDGTTGKLNLKDPAIAGLNDFRARFSGRLHELNPDFAAADAAYAKFAGQGGAAERGYNANSIRVTPDATERALGMVPQDNLPFYRQGYASSMADTVERGRLSGDPYNMIYGSPAQQQKLGTVFPEGAPTFAKGRGLESDMSKTAYETLGGSPTASRMEADSLFNSENLESMVDLGTSALTGTPPLKAMRDIWKMGIGKAAKNKADKIGPLLLDTNPKVSLKMLEDWAAQEQARRAWIQQTRRAGGMFGAPLALPFIPNQ